VNSSRAILGRVTDPLATDETRIDRWLCAARLVKTRPIATRLCERGHVLVNGSPAKPSTKVRAGDRVEALIADRERVVRSRCRSNRASGPQSPPPAMWTTARPP
jgi:ribosome-associated heat shock protein Hsp15